MTKTLQMLGLGHCSTCQKAMAALQEAGWTVASVSYTHLTLPTSDLV